VVKVVDFGLVKSIEASQDASVTGATTVTGTPLFLSPEAIRSPESVDARSDLYALGALAYRLVTGHHLFDSENFIEVCSLQLNERPTPPSARLGQAVPEDLERLIMKCLEKKPDERVQSASELRQGLEECADAGRWTEDAARRWWKEVLPRLGNDEPPVASSAATRTL
jgi:serine/threonine-protein kinase